MDPTVNLEPASDEPAELREAIRAMFAEMRRIDERIKRDQAEIERLQLQTRKKLRLLNRDFYRRTPGLNPGSRQTTDDFDDPLHWGHGKHRR
jgi:hypothetical protein